jgi:hypothetical protein
MPIAFYSDVSFLYVWLSIQGKIEEEGWKKKKDTDMDSVIDGQKR